MCSATVPSAGDAGTANPRLVIVRVRRNWQRFGPCGCWTCLVIGAERNLLAPSLTFRSFRRGEGRSTIVIEHHGRQVGSVILVCNCCTNFCRLMLQQIGTRPIKG